VRYLFISLLVITYFPCLAQEQIVPVNQPKVIETSPCIYPDGHAIMYAANPGGKWKIFEISVLESGQFGTVHPVDLLNRYIDSSSRIAGLFLSYDGNFLLFSSKLKNSLGGMDIYQSSMINGQWTEPLNLGPEINTADDEESPSMNSLSNTIYFTRKVSQDPQLGNCKKIFVSEKSVEGKWEVPHPLPQRVNLGCETTPRICADNRTLYFASVREGNKGGFDIYQSHLLAPNVWSDPVPIDTLNKPSDEIFPSVTFDGTKLVFKRQVARNNVDFGNIFYTHTEDKFLPQPMAILEGQVKDLETALPVEAVISISDANSSKTYLKISSHTTDGLYKAILNTGTIYNIDITKTGYSHDKFTFDAGQLKPIKETRRNGIFPSVTLILNVFDSEIIEPLQSDLTLTDLQDKNAVNSTVKIIAAGRYSLRLPIGKTYKIKLHKENYTDTSFVFDLNAQVQFNEFERDILLSPIKTEFEINIADLETNQEMDVQVVFTNLGKNEVITQKPVKNKAGKYVVKLRKGDKYEVNVNSPKGYAFYSTKVNMDENQQNQKLDVKLTALKPKTRLTLKEITFQSNSAELASSSFAELDRVVKLMVENADLRIEISAHTDDIGSDSYNLKLSDKRSESVVSYLIEKSIQVSRLVAKGYGKSLPLVPNTSDENRSRNRRVELKIIDQN
jgi:outer membrane protein OmpA-like peptidoglycan-associated protein/Tol biopolymer transport system component